MTRTLTLTGYALVAVVAVALEVAARRSGRLARAAEAVRLALGVPGLRVLVGIGWLWLGWHLFVRTDWR